MDLSLISLEDLIDEMEKRTTSMIIGLVRPENNVQEVGMFRWKGSKFMAIGLARCVEKKVMNDVVETGNA